MFPWSWMVSYLVIVRLTFKCTKKLFLCCRLRQRRSFSLGTGQLVFRPEPRDVLRDGAPSGLDSGKSSHIAEPFTGRDHFGSAQRTMAGKRDVPCRSGPTISAR